MTIISDIGAEQLCDAIYRVAVSDILTEWRARRDGKDTCFIPDSKDKKEKNKRKAWEEILSHSCDAKCFLNKTSKGRRVLSILNGLTDEEKEKLMKDYRKKQ